jgi:hypothetical protein
MARFGNRAVFFYGKNFSSGFFRRLVAKDPVFVLWVAKGHETPPSESEV